MDSEVKGNLEINKEENYVLASINPKIYPIDVVFSASYLFLDRSYVLIDGDPLEEIIVELRPKKSGEDVEMLGRDFNNELLNYANYAVNAIKSAKVREAILKKVLDQEKKAVNDNSASSDAPWIER